jgi:hypothetical protein
MASSVIVTRRFIEEFAATYRAACRAALPPSATPKKGPHCKFCPAIPICPEHANPLIELAQTQLPNPAKLEKQEYLKLLAHILDLFDIAKTIGKAAHDQAKHAVENGATVPGYSLSAGRTERHWAADEKTTVAALEIIGLARGDIIAEELRSPRQIELRAKPRGLTIPENLIASRRSGTSLVRTENARAPILGGGDARLFAEELNLLIERTSNGLWKR